MPITDNLQDNPNLPSITKCPEPGHSIGLRRGRDSNPRYRFKSVQRFSKPALSATQAPLRTGAAKIIISCKKTQKKQIPDTFSATRNFYTALIKSYMAAN